MPAMQYSQFCALARAAEVLGERWTLLIVRELLLGPKRFVDLRRRLHGVSTSVLTERLTHLETDGLIRRTYLEPPAASTVYELTDDGQALRPAVLELIRWGARRLLPPRPGERIEPEWVLLALEACARQDATPGNVFLLRVHDADRVVQVRVSGGAQGTTVEPVSGDPGEVDAVIEGDPGTILALASGVLPPEAAAHIAGLSIQGTTVDAFPLFFSVSMGGMARGEKHDTSGHQ